MGIEVVIRAQVAVCGMRCIDLKRDTLKLLGSHFSYNEIFKVEKKNCQSVTDIQGVLKKWNIRKLTLERKMAIFKTIAISKIVFQ